MHLLDISAAHFQGWSKKTVSVNNFVSKLHHRYTFLFFICIGAFMKCQELMGDGMGLQCTDANQHYSTMLLQCYIIGTYTVNQPGNLSNHPDDVLINLGITTPGKDNRTYHHIYQWMTLILVMQGVSFLLPQYIWKKYYGFQLHAMILNFYRVFEVVPEMERNYLQLQPGMTVFSSYVTSQFIFSLAGNMKFHERIKSLVCWSYFLLLKELANFFNVAAQFWILTQCLGGNVLEILNHSLTNEHGYRNPFDVLFPKLAKCDFARYGSSGGITTMDSLCVLSYNMFYEKLYFIMWIWFGILTVLSYLAILWRIFGWLCYRNKIFNQYILHLWYDIRKDEKVYKHLGDYTKSFYNQSSYTDWLILNTVGQNIDNRLFRALLHMLSRIQDDKIVEAPALPHYPKDFKSFVLGRLRYNLNEDFVDNLDEDYVDNLDEDFVDKTL